MCLRVGCIVFAVCLCVCWLFGVLYVCACVLSKMCAYLSVGVGVCLYVWVGSSVCVYIYKCMCVCVHVYTCVVCVHVYPSSSTQTVPKTKSSLVEVLFLAP